MRQTVFFVLVSSVACRTEIAPSVREDQAPIVTTFRAKTGGCDVLDYSTATDVPQGSASLGWVQVKRLPSDEDTYVALRQAVCDRGGNGLSQMLWTREEDEKEPTILKANAWKIEVR
jgi:hypothetical protein